MTKQSSVFVAADHSEHSLTELDLAQLADPVVGVVASCTCSFEGYLTPLAVSSGFDAAGTTTGVVVVVVVLAVAALSAAVAVAMATAIQLGLVYRRWTSFWRRVWLLFCPLSHPQAMQRPQLRLFCLYHDHLWWVWSLLWQAVWTLVGLLD